MLFKLLARCVLLVFIPVLYGQDAKAKPTQGQQAGLQQSQADKRQQVHSQQVHGGIPGQITQQLAATSGDIHLRNLQSPPLTIQLDPLSTLENLTCENDLVVLGTLKDGSSHPTVDNAYIYTDWNLTVNEIIKNNSASPVQAGQTIVVTHPGGTLEIAGRHVYAETGEPQLQPGNEVLLYLRYLKDSGTYSLSSPNGFIFFDTVRIDLDKARFAQFGKIQRDDLLNLARKSASEKCALGGQR